MKYYCPTCHSESITTIYDESWVTGFNPTTHCGKHKEELKPYEETKKSGMNTPTFQLKGNGWPSKAFKSGQKL